MKNVLKIILSALIVLTVTLVLNNKSFVEDSLAVSWSTGFQVAPDGSTRGYGTGPEGTHYGEWSEPNPDFAAEIFGSSNSTSASNQGESTQTTSVITDQAPTTTQTTQPVVTAPQTNPSSTTSSSASNKSASSNSSSNSSSESSTTTTQKSQNAISKPVAYTGAIGLSMIGAGLYMYLPKFF